MFTKRDFAEYLIMKHADSEGITVEEVKANPVLNTYKSTSCGLALQYLGLLVNARDKDINRYLEGMAGSFLQHYIENPKVNEPHIKFLSIREMFTLLPEKLEGEE
jgi:hypothetical protein